MNDVVNAVARWRARGDEVALATVVATRRSAPRPVGSKLAVSSGDEIAGSVSGGCVEPDVVEHARAVLAGEQPRVVSYGIDDDVAWGIGLPCGGEIDVLVERLDGEAPLAAPVGFALVTVLDGASVGAKRIVAPGDDEDVDELLAARRSGVVEREGERLFCEVAAPPLRLLVIGAVDLAEALCRAAKLLGWRTTVVDPRRALATHDRLPSADDVAVAWPEETIARLAPDRDTAVVVLTHDEKLDVPALAGALRTDAFYVGALGSRRTQERRRERLLDEGFGEADLERIAGPCGLDVGAETTAETAVSILAEIVAVRTGRAGGRLSEASGPIHAATA